MHHAAEKAAKVLDVMAQAIDPNGMAQMSLVNWSHGPTYNDGGTWYSSVWRMPGGVLKRAFIGTDYRMEDIEVERVVQRDFHGIEYEGRGR